MTTISLDQSIDSSLKLKEQAQLELTPMVKLYEEYAACVEKYEIFKNLYEKEENNLRRIMEGANPEHEIILKEFEQHRTGACFVKRNFRDKEQYKRMLALVKELGYDTKQSEKQDWTGKKYRYAIDWESKKK